MGRQEASRPAACAGLKSHALKGPLKGLNALNDESAAELHQLVNELAEKLGIDVEPPAVYQRDIEAVIYHATTGDELVEAEAPLSAATPVAMPPKPVNQHGFSASEYVEAEQVIAKHCEREWPDDYRMRDYCVNQQRAAVEKLLQDAPSEVPLAVFSQIRCTCAREWPNDYSMRQYAEEQQLAAYRRLHPSR